MPSRLPEKLITVKKILALQLLVLPLLTALSCDLYAADRWISDTIYVPLRSGKGNQFRIVNKGLKSGTPLKFIPEESDEDWIYVETDKGEIGWVRSQYVTDTPPAFLQLARAEKQLEKLSTQKSELEQQLKAVTTENTDLKRSLQQETTEASSVERELQEIKQISSGAIELNQRHQALMEKHQLIQTELDVLKAENSRLKSDSRNTFFLYGVGAVLLGVIIALVAPNLRRRKRFSEWA